MKKISRRSFLMATGVIAASAALSACGGSSASTSSAIAQPLHHRLCRRELSEYPVHTVHTCLLRQGQPFSQSLCLMAVMGLGIKQGETITVTVEGDDETARNDRRGSFRAVFCVMQ